MPPYKPLQERLLSRIIIVESGCWEWRGARTYKGYGVISLSRIDKHEHVHRTSWKIFRGPISDGLFVLHHCDNRACINPDHLFLGTAKENTDDMIKKGRCVSGEQSPNHRLTKSQVCEIRHRKKCGESIRLLGRKFNVSHTTILRICQMQMWKD